jgi:hypothetical protein
LESCGSRQHSRKRFQERRILSSYQKALEQILKDSAIDTRVVSSYYLAEVVSTPLEAVWPQLDSVTPSLVLTLEMLKDSMMNIRVVKS